MCNDVSYCLGFGGILTTAVPTGWH